MHKCIQEDISTYVYMWIYIYISTYACMSNWDICVCQTSNIHSHGTLCMIAVYIYMHIYIYIYVCTYIHTYMYIPYLYRFAWTAYIIWYKGYVQNDKNGICNMTTRVYGVATISRLLKLEVYFSKEPHKRDYILIPVILRYL